VPVTSVPMLDGECDGEMKYLNTKNDGEK